MFNALFTLVALAGILILILGNMWFLVRAFQESILWGLGCLLLPFVSLAFLILHWRSAKDPFFLALYGLGAVFLVAVIAPGALPGR
jgi:hypothetical protein